MDQTNSAMSSMDYVLSQMNGVSTANPFIAELKNISETTKLSGLECVYILNSWSGSRVEIPPGDVFFSE